MIAGVTDRSFGNAGTIWSTTPTPYGVPPFRDSHPACVSGSAIGVQRLGDAPALVVGPFGTLSRSPPDLMADGSIGTVRLV